MNLIGIRINKEGTDESVRKNLSSEWYPFFDRFRMKDLELPNWDDNDKLLVELKKKDKECRDANADLYNQSDERPQISLHAIVGKNGSGKSTLLDVLVRIINNLAFKAVSDTGGELNLLEAKGVNAALFYKIEDKYYCLGSNELIVLGEKAISFSDSQTLKENRKLLERFFYSVFVNYSIYAFNVRDYADVKEKGPVTQKVGGHDLYYKDNNGKEHKYKLPYYEHWLNGLFHKNDGYLTPIVLNPMRTEGNYDVNTEEALTKQRLLSLFVLKSDFLAGYESSKTQITFQIKIIQDKISKQMSWFPGNETQYYEHIADLYHWWWKELIDGKDVATIINKLNVLKDSSNIGKSNLCELDAENMKSFLKGDTGLNNRIIQIQSSLIYLAYKTSSIGSKYPNFYTKFENEEEINILFEHIKKDNTHITLKIRQTIYNLKNRLLRSDDKLLPQLNPRDINFKDDFGSRDTIKSADDVLEKLFPPIYKSEVLLTNREGKDISFTEMSSGERQFLYSLSSVLYHLMNLQSVESGECTLHYGNINIIMDEVELYYHPEYQRQFVNRLLDSIKGLKLTGIDSINICLVTHSPFLLSDIPKQNILFLEEGKVVNDKVESLTFAANINDIIKDSFFLKGGFMGEFAKNVIASLFSYIAPERGNPPSGYIRTWSPSDAQAVIKMIGEPMIQSLLQSLYHANKSLMDDQEIQNRIDELQREQRRRRQNEENTDN
ncbi:MAG: AAA family ATPase [Mediterranea sp.]|jgi:predicted ATPase|nr:AAA family ATPase [Mediterranea sp.]